MTSIDRDGTKTGFDTALLRAITSRVRVPVIASGGASGPAHMVAAIATAARTRSSPRRSSTAASTRSSDVKAAMAAAGLPVRLAAGTAEVTA